MNINELEELAKAATTGPWIGAGPSFGAAMPKFINEVLVDRPDEEDDSYEICRSPYYFEDGASNDLLYIAAANPSAISELIAAYRGAVAALGEIYSINASKHGTSGMMIARCINVAGNALETAKRLGVE